MNFRFIFTHNVLRLNLFEYGLFERGGGGIILINCHHILSFAFLCTLLYFGTLLAFSVTALVPMHQDSREATATPQKLEEKVMPNARQR